MDAPAIFDWLLTAILTIVVFATVFTVLYIAVISAPGRGPGWLVWPILAFMVSASSFAAYTIVVEPAFDDDEADCASDIRESSTPCLNPPVS